MRATAEEGTSILTAFHEITFPSWIEDLGSFVHRAGPLVAVVLRSLVVVNWTVWEAGEAYAKGALVSNGTEEHEDIEGGAVHENIIWESLTNENEGNEPGESPEAWKQVGLEKGVATLPPELCPATKVGLVALGPLVLPDGTMFANSDEEINGIPLLYRAALASP